MESYVLHRIKLIESFRMISKSSKSTDGNALKNRQELEEKKIRLFNRVRLNYYGLIMVLKLKGVEWEANLSSKPLNIYAKISFTII